MITRAQWQKFALNEREYHGRKKEAGRYRTVGEGKDARVIRAKRDEMFLPNELVTKINDLENVRLCLTETGEPVFNKWEQDFIDSICEQYEERKSLSKKQIEIAETLWERI